jgi:transposase-like protein
MRNRASGGSRWQRAIKEGALWTEADARDALEACASSGESIWVFARRHGVVPERLYRWKRVLKKKRRRATPVGPMQKRDLDARLIPVTVRAAPVETPKNEQVVVVDGALRLEIGTTSAVSPGWVAALLRLVREGGA